MDERVTLLPEDQLVDLQKQTIRLASPVCCPILADVESASPPNHDGNGDGGW